MEGTALAAKRASGSNPIGIQSVQVFVHRLIFRTGKGPFASSYQFFGRANSHKMSAYLALRKVPTLPWSQRDSIDKKRSETRTDNMRRGTVLHLVYSGLLVVSWPIR